MCIRDSVSDALGMIARPVETIRFEQDDYDSALTQIKKYIDEFQVKKAVLGLPKHMNGDVGIRGEISIMFKEKLEKMCIRDRNNALQKMMNPSTAHKRELKVGYRIFRVGDKVLQLKNQPEDEVYNGDIGEIVDIAYASESVGQKHQLLVDFDGIMVEYSNEQLYNITHAFCISIHKAQGSEYPIVILPIVSEYAYMMSKRLLYKMCIRDRVGLSAH